MTHSNNTYDKFIVSYRDFERGKAQADFQRVSGFSRLGVTHVTLAPGESILVSSPNEELLVFVIEGNPQLLVDDDIRQLKPFEAIGFPLIKSTSASILNRSSTQARLLQLSLPGQPNELKEENSATVVDVNRLPLSQGWHYPGDSETFGQYVRLTNHLGLKCLGVGFDSLPTGRRSCFPHAHTHEEEFCFVLSGRGMVWLNGATYPIEAGMGVAFPANSGLSHCMINDSDEPLNYLTAGEAGAHEGEKIIYPLHPQRNEQCRRLNALWTDAPVALAGSHNGRPAIGLKDHLCLRTVTARDKEEILSIFQRSPGYFERCDGVTPTLNSVEIAMTDGPKKKIETYLKEFMIIDYDDQAIGVIDLHRNHPEPGMTYLGLLLITEDLFGRGLGRKSYQLIEDYVRRDYKSKKIRLGVSDDNDVDAFWRKMGFTPDGHTYEFKGENKTTHVVEYEKDLD